MKANEVIDKIKEAKIGREVLDIWQSASSMKDEDAIKIHQGAYEEIMKSLEVVYPPNNAKLL